MERLKVLSVFGTRPEAIKMCPLAAKLRQCDCIESFVCVTAQHRMMLDQVLEIFHLRPDYDLDLMKESQSLTQITTGVLTQMEPVLKELNPDIVLVHGDTTTAMATALAAFYQKIPVGHVEAGLRTYNRYYPFPEEMNRQLLSKISTLHFAPTMQNAENLRMEGITEHVFITGNTVIDSFQTTIQKDYRYHQEVLNQISTQGKRMLLVTAHRRENLGSSLENICRMLSHVVQEYEDLIVIYPVHPNPKVQETVHRILDHTERIHLLPPLDVQDMHNLMANSYLIVTDSGGIQEEAPSLNVPVIVARNETERMEAVACGTILLGGVEEEPLYEKVCELMNHKEKYNAMISVDNPYGDGNASKRIVSALLQWRKNLK